MSGMVGLVQMLEARERRAVRQRALLEQYQLPLVSFSMNIAGPVKNSPSIRRGFHVGRGLLIEQLTRVKASIVFSDEIDQDTGCEGLYVVDLEPETLKEITCDIEDYSDLGCLFDFDVLTPNGIKLERAEPRRCLICGKPAKECARSRTHSVEELQIRTHDLLVNALDRYDAECAASLAVRALLYEVCTTPKPGLVDRVNNGSHKDMDIYTFMTSASVLWPYFAECTRTGRATAARPAPKTFAAIRWPGKQAEGIMLLATHSVNTHKGAIFSMGLVCAALGRLERENWDKPELVLGQAAAMTQGVVKRELEGMARETAQTAGQRFYVEYGITGVRGQAEAGFPEVLKYGLPVLENGLALGKSLDEAGGAAMLALLAHTIDTNMISRGGAALQREKCSELRALLDHTPYPDKTAIEALDQAYIKKNLSPGGSADLLSLCYLLHFLKEAA